MMTMCHRFDDDALSALAIAYPMVPDAPVRRQTFVSASDDDVIDIIFCYLTRFCFCFCFGVGAAGSNGVLMLGVGVWGDCCCLFRLWPVRTSVLLPAFAVSVSVCSPPHLRSLRSTPVASRVPQTAHPNVTTGTQWGSLI